MPSHQTEFAMTPCDNPSQSLRLLPALAILTLALLPLVAHAQPEIADLTIVKESHPGDDTPFPFFLVSPSNDTTFFTLMDPSDPDTTFLELPVGTYEIWEVLPKFWALGIVFGGSGLNTPNDSLAGTTAVLEADDSLTVTLGNTKFGFDVLKTATLFFDQGTPNVADAGDSLKYTIHVIETEGPVGNLFAADFELMDSPDPNTTLDWGSVEVMASNGSPSVIEGNGTGDTSVWVEASTLVGDTTTIMFKVVVNDDFPPLVADFCNQAVVKGQSTTRNTPLIPSDDPDDPTSAEDETCVPAGATNLPVELSSFEGRVMENDVELTWTTLSETNNAGFSVEMKEETESAFVEAGFVEGRGTTLEPQTYRFDVEDLDPGSYSFRLKQIDFDGAFHYSATVAAAIEVSGSFYLSEAYPNPFNPLTTLRLGVPADQPVNVAVFDALGKRVRVLHDGIVDRDNVMQLHFDAKNLPSGLYFVRATGAAFAATRTALLMK